MNISKQVNDSFTDSQANALRMINRLAVDSGARSALVGGTVRDMILGRQIRDLDVTVECDPGILFEGLPKSYDVDVIKKSQFNTLKVRINQILVDVAMSRSERYEAEGALPMVSPSSLEEDLARRDITINSIAMSLHENSWGQIIDLHEGVSDLRSRTIRVLHRKSFADDPTRIFRVIKYASRLGFCLDPDTLDCLLTSLIHLRNVSGKRITNELSYIFDEVESVNIVKVLSRLGVFRAVHPEMRITDESLRALEQLKLAQKSEDLEAFFVLIACSVSPKEREVLSKRLLLDKAQVNDVLSFEVLESLNGNVTRRQLYDKLQFCTDPCLKAGSVYFEGEVLTLINTFVDELRDVQLKINGEDVISLGLAPGPQVGEILCKVRLEVIESDCCSREQQLKLAQELIQRQF